MKKKKVYKKAKKQETSNKKLVLFNKLHKQVIKHYTSTIKSVIKRNNNSIFKDLIDSSPLPTSYTNDLKKIEYVNPAWEKLTGFRFKEVKGKNSDFIIGSKTSSKVYKNISNNLNSGKPYKTEILFNKTKDGKEIQMSSTFFPIKNKKNILYYAQIEHDITHRILKEKYRTMYSNIAILLSHSSTIQEAIPKTLKYLCEGGGWEMGELWLNDEEKKQLVFHGAWHSLSLNTRSFISQCKKITFAKGKGLPGRVWETGKATWVMKSPKKLYFPNIFTTTKIGVTTAIGFPIHVDSKTLGVMTFFTLKARQLNEDLLRVMSNLGSHLGQFIERRRNEEMIKHLVTQQQLILNAAGQGIYGMDHNGYVTFVNSVAAKMLGYRPDELIGKRLHDMIHYTKNDKKTPMSYYECPINKILQRKIKFALIENEVYWRKDGTNFPIEYILTPIMDGSRVLGAVATFIDITKRQKIEKLKQEFMNIAAHELKTPITTLKLLSQQQIRKIKKNEKIKQKDLEFIDRELDRLTRIINDILDDQRIETGKLNLQFENIEITSVTKEVEKQMQSLSPRHKIIINNKEKVKVYADLDRIKQVLTNIISNAIKYSPEDTTITVQAKKDRNMLIISVNDQGIGIPNERQAFIFDKYYQIQEGKTSGFGLGLYISKQIIERHNGKIWVESKEGQGSTFYFSLPIIKPTTRLSPEAKKEGRQ